MTTPAHPQLAVSSDIVQLDAVPRAEDYPILKARTANLDEIAPYFALFTPGLLHTHGGLVQDPVREFVLAHPDSSCDVAIRDFDVPLFSGIARDVSEEVWDRRLYFIERRFWPELLQFLSGVTLVDSRRKTYGESWPHAVPVGMRPGEATAFATVFGVRGSVPGVGLRVNAVGFPALYTIPSVPRLQALARSVFKLGPEALGGAQDECHV